MEKKTVSTMLDHFSIYTVMLGSSPADISVTDISVIPQEIAAGGDATIEALVMNSGEVPGNYGVVLTINGVVYETREITVDGGASVVVSFQVSDLESGDYLVELGGVKLEFSVLPEAELVPASFEVSSLSVSPSEVDIGDEVEIFVIVSNSGESAGNYEIELNINGEIIETREVHLAGGESQEIIFTTIAESAGKKIVQINGLLSSLVVAGEVSPPGHVPLPLEEPDTIPEPEPTVVVEPVVTEESTLEAEIAERWRIFVPIIIACVVVVAMVGYLAWRHRWN